MAAVTRLGPGGTPIAVPQVQEAAAELTLTIGVIPLTADSTEWTADSTVITADQTYIARDDLEAADTVSGSVTVGVEQQPATGGGAGPVHLVSGLVFPRPIERPRLPELTLRISAVEGADSVTGAVTVHVAASIAAAEDADIVIASVSIGVTAFGAVTDDADLAAGTLEINAVISDDEIMALMLAEAA